MGWFSPDYAGHEGYLVGFVRSVESSALWRELGYPDDESQRVLVERLAVACDCGWRSPRFHAPFGTVAEWHPFSIALRPKIDNESGRQLVWRAEESARALWLVHAKACERIRIHDACAMLSDLAAGRST